MDEQLGVDGGLQEQPPLTPDEVDAQCVDNAVQFMIDHVLSGWAYARPLNSLNKDDLRKLATNAVIGFIVKHSELDGRCRAFPELDQILNAVSAGETWGNHHGSVSIQTHGPIADALPLKEVRT